LGVLVEVLHKLGVGGKKGKKKKGGAPGNKKQEK